MMHILLVVNLKVQSLHKYLQISCNIIGWYNWW